LARRHEQIVYGHEVATLADAVNARVGWAEVLGAAPSPDRDAEFSVVG
jgi:hypothetical protein